jgi:hypothetical protein
MDVLICLQRLLRCYLLLFAKVINEGGGVSKFKHTTYVTALEKSPSPIPKFNMPLLNLSFCFPSLTQSNTFQHAHGKRNAAQFCELN